MAATDPMPTPPPGYVFERYSAPVSPAFATEVVQFLGGFGPHFNGVGATWGPDFYRRLTDHGEGGRESGASVVAVLARVNTKHDGDTDTTELSHGHGEIAAHACVLYSSERPAVGALFHVR